MSFLRLDERDERNARNLRAFAPHLELPDNPSAARRAAWKSQPSFDPLPIERMSMNSNSKGAFSMRKSRLFTVMGAGLAAAVMALAILVTPGPSSQVQAATIFRNLREAAHRGFRIQLENFRDEGVAVDARLEVLFAAPVTVSLLIDGKDEEFPEPESLYVDAKVIGQEGDPGTAGLDIEAAIALTEADSWAYLKLNGLPEQVFEENPGLEGILNVLAREVLLDLKGMEEFLDDGDSEKPRSLLKLHFDDFEEDERGSAGDEHDEEDADAEDEAADGMVSQDFDLDQQMRALLTGTLERGQMAQVVGQLESMAQNVTLRETQPGRWMLVASDFRTESLAADAARLMRAAVLSISYEEGVGVQLVELNHLGDGHGRLRFEFIDASDPNLVRRERFLERGARLIELRKVLGAFGVSH